MTPPLSTNLPAGQCTSSVSYASAWSVTFLLTVWYPVTTGACPHGFPSEVTGRVRHHAQPTQLATQFFSNSKDALRWATDHNGGGG